MEKHNLRLRGLNLLKMKMDTYSDKIRDIFETHVERPESDSEGNDVDIPKESYVVRISRLSRVMNDMGAFVGLAFSSFNSFLSNLHDTRKTEPAVVKQLQFFMWLKTHKVEIEKVWDHPRAGQDGREYYKKKGETILKKPSSWPVSGKSASSEDSQKSISEKNEFTIWFED